jgi:hypothetical protein
VDLPAHTLDPTRNTDHMLMVREVDRWQPIAGTSDAGEFPCAMYPGEFSPRHFSGGQFE